MTLTLREYDSLTVGAGKDLTRKETERLYVLAERARQRLHHKPPVLTRTHDGGLKAEQVVGVLAVPGKTPLEILPKIDGDDGAVRKALIHMLAVAHRLRVADGELASLDTQRRDLLELLIGLFANRLLSAVRRGPCPVATSGMRTISSCCAGGSTSPARSRISQLGPTCSPAASTSYPRTRPSTASSRRPCRGWSA